MAKENKTRENWWPKPLAHVRDIDPWADTDVVVAEIQSFDDASHTGHRHVFSALVPVAELADVSENLARFEYSVQASGPRPSARPGHPYTPKFWIEREGSPRYTYEPLVLSWQSHDKTVLQLDPGVNRRGVPTPIGALSYSSNLRWRGHTRALIHILAR